MEVKGLLVVSIMKTSWQGWSEAEEEWDKSAELVAREGNMPIMQTLDVPAEEGKQPQCPPTSYSCDIPNNWGGT